MPEVIANFSAGPSALPRAVRQIIAEGLQLKSDASPSLIEVSHRGPAFGEVAEALREQLCQLMELDGKHELLLLQGGANQQFAQLPLNFAQSRPPAYLLTGHWGEKALAEAERIGPVVVAASAADRGYTGLPEIEQVDADWAYLHYTGNETIQGVQFDQPPSVASVPVVADLSSEFLSRPYPYSSLSGFYAGAQKNLGVAGLTIVGLSKEWLAEITESQTRALPKFFDYRAWVESDSMFNTPTTFAWWVALEMCRWIDLKGGLEAIDQLNQQKSDRLYQCIDASGFYQNPVEHTARSVMNVPFWLHDAALESVFVEEANASGLLGLKGHRAVGGLRASLYNAIEDQAVVALVEFMREFERQHG
ncbi:MAG TPA: 3-phosphoserine/phosphohydroxythreonine transaminase [Wenzhouxiangella sp.]